MTEAYDGPGVLVNSGPMTGKRVPEELPEIIRWLEETGRGQAEVTYRLRDWLISRQRYWGTPIPVDLLRRLRHGPGAGGPAAGGAAAGRRVHPHRAVAAGDARELPQHDLSAAAAAPRGARPTPWTPSSIRPGTGSATPRRTRGGRPVRPGDGRALDPGRSLLRRYRARHPASALRSLLHQGDPRSGPDRARRAVPAPAQPGHDPGRRGDQDEQEPGHHHRPGRAGRASTAPTPCGCT